MLQNTQEGLYRLGKNGKPLKAIATHTKLTNGGKTYTIDLRHDAKWSNGDPVTAQNFVYSWRRTLTPKTAAQMQDYLYPVVNAKEIFAGKKAPSTLGITAHGPYKLTHSTHQAGLLLEDAVGVAGLLPGKPQDCAKVREPLRDFF